MNEKAFRHKLRYVERSQRKSSNEQVKTRKILIYSNQILVPSIISNDKSFVLFEPHKLWERRADSCTSSVFNTTLVSNLDR